MNEAKQFYVFRLKESATTFTHQQQDDYYAISLLSNNTPGSGAMLCFYNPQHTLPAGRSVPARSDGFSCMFNAAFLSQKMQGILQALPMFRKEDNPVYFLNPKQNNSISELFEKMLEEVNNNYTFKYELLGNYLAEIIHHALKINTNTCAQVTQTCGN